MATTVYKFRSSLTTNGGSGSVNTLNIKGGVCRQFWVSAGTSTTTFRATLTDDDSDVIRQYDYHREEINDTKSFAAVGQYTVNVTNASADGPFTIKMMVVE